MFVCFRSRTSGKEFSAARNTTRNRADDVSLLCAAVISKICIAFAQDAAVSSLLITRLYLRGVPGCRATWPPLCVTEVSTCSTSRPIPPRK